VHCCCVCRLHQVPLQLVMCLLSSSLSTPLCALGSISSVRTNTVTAKLAAALAPVGDQVPDGRSGEWVGPHAGGGQQEGACSSQCSYLAEGSAESGCFRGGAVRIWVPGRGDTARRTGHCFLPCHGTSQGVVRLLAALQGLHLHPGCESPALCVWIPSSIDISVPDAWCLVLCCMLGWSQLQTERSMRALPNTQGEAEAQSYSMVGLPTEVRTFLTHEKEGRWYAAAVHQKAGLFPPF